MALSPQMSSESPDRRTPSRALGSRLGGIIAVAEKIRRVSIRNSIEGNLRSALAVTAIRSPSDEVAAGRIPRPDRAVIAVG